MKERGTFKQQNITLVFAKGSVERGVGAANCCVCAKESPPWRANGIRRNMDEF